MKQLSVVCLWIFCLAPLSSNAQTYQLPKDINTMISDCMMDSRAAIQAQMNIRKTLENAVGKQRADEITEEQIADIQKAVAVCAKRTPDEKVEIEQKYAEEYGYKRQPTYGASSALEPGGMLNPIQVQILPMR